MTVSDSGGGKACEDWPCWAASAGWTSEQLAEAFASLGLAVFTAYFLNYAATELDIPGA